MSDPSASPASAAFRAPRVEFATPHAAEPPTVLDRVLLGVLLLLGLALRAWEGYRTPLWFDEIYILNVVTRPFAEAMRMVANDIHPPLYYLVRWVWTAAGSDHNTWQKTLSLVIAAGSLLATFRLGRIMFGWRTGLVALAFVAVNGAHAHYSQEVENYALAWTLILMSAGSAWSFVSERLARGPAGAPSWGRIAGFVVWTLLALYDHYLALSTTLVLAVWGAVRLRRDPAGLRAWLMALGAIALVFLPQALIFGQQFVREGSASFFTFPTLADYRAVWRAAAFSFNPLVPVFLALALLPFLSRALRPAALLLWLLVIIPILEKRLWVVILPREGLLAISLAALLVAAGISMIPGRWVRTGLALALVVAGLRSWTRRSENREPFALDRIARFVDTHAAPGQTLVHAETHSLLFFMHRMPTVRHRILVESGKRVPYFDAGLAVPDSAYMSFEQFGALTQSGEPWMAIEVDRAFVTHGVVSRAGADAITRIETAPRDTAIADPPARLVVGRSSGR